MRTKKPHHRTPRQLAHAFAQMRYSGMDGLVWYSRVRTVAGDALRVGDWLDTVDHRGARRIQRIEETSDLYRTVRHADGAFEEIDRDEECSVVDPDSLVDPTGGKLRPTWRDWRDALWALRPRRGA